MRMTRTLALSAALLLAPSSLPAQGMGHHAGIGASRVLDPQNTSGAVSSLSTTVDMPASLRPPAAVAPAGTVGVRDLLVPPKAVKEFDRSMKALGSRDLPSAARHLEKATQLAPDFVQAHNNLGAVYIDLRQYDGAVIQLQKTIDLNPGLKAPYHNLGIAMMLLGRLPEAETAARRAWDLAPQEPADCFLLGRILVMEQRKTSETVELLTRAVTEIPQARLPLALVLQNRGEVDHAIAVLQAYVQVPAAENKEFAQTWLAQLTKAAAKSSGTLPPLEKP
jgi:lipopolysaccharide biosynthesis regulator YciM